MACVCSLQIAEENHSKAKKKRSQLQEKVCVNTVVAVPGRNRTLSRIFQLRYRIRRAVAQNFR